MDFGEKILNELIDEAKNMTTEEYNDLYNRSKRLKCMDLKKIEKKANEFWNNLTQEEFERLWDKYEIHKFYDEEKMTTKERPILFNTEMVRAIFEGRKTQTRRVVKEPVSISSKILQEPRPHSPMIMHKGCWYKPTEWSPYGKVGDRLWVRETWAYTNDSDINIIWDRDILYRATDQDHYPNKWKSPIFMHRWASRITLEITDIRIERIKDISIEDIQREGLVDECDETVLTNGEYSYHKSGQWLKDIWINLWNSINEKRGYGWNENPWVWMIEFKQV